MKLYLREYRKMAGYTQEDFASLLGLCRVTYNLTENGHRNLAYNEGLVISDMFGISNLYEKPTKESTKGMKIKMLRKRFIEIGVELIRLGYSEIQDDIYEIIQGPGNH